MKICSYCSTPKPEAEFNRNAVRKDGLQTFCRECQKTRKHAYYAANVSKFVGYAKKRRAQFAAEIDEYKRERGCECCPENEPCCLDFHHRDTGDKNDNVATMMRDSGQASVWREIAKCVILCANCHRKLHKGLVTPKDRETVDASRHSN